MLLEELPAFLRLVEAQDERVPDTPARCAGGIGDGVGDRPQLAGVGSRLTST